MRSAVAVVVALASVSAAAAAQGAPSPTLLAAGPSGVALSESGAPALASGPGGAAVAVWSGRASDGVTRVYARPIDAAGRPSGSVSVLGAGSAGTPAVAYSARLRRFLAAWDDHAVVTRVLDRAGVPQGPAARVAEAPAPDGRLSALARGDGWLLAWSAGRPSRSKPWSDRSVRPAGRSD